MPFRGILSGFLTNQCVIVFRAPAARSCDSVEGFVRLQAHKTFHTVTKQARLRAKPGEEATFEKQSASILHRQVRSCILAIAEKQNTNRVDASG